MTVLTSGTIKVSSCPTVAVIWSTWLRRTGGLLISPGGVLGGFVDVSQFIKPLYEIFVMVRWSASMPKDLTSSSEGFSPSFVIACKSNPDLRRMVIDSTANTATIYLTSILLFSTSRQEFLHSSFTGFIFHLSDVPWFNLS